MGIQERIKEIELELSRTQKNKATTTHIGMLKGQLARLRTQLLLPPAGSDGAGGHEGFAVPKSGDGRVALIGFPSVNTFIKLSISTLRSPLSAGLSNVLGWQIFSFERGHRHKIGDCRV